MGFDIIGEDNRDWNVEIVFKIIEDIDRNLG